MAAKKKRRESKVRKFLRTAKQGYDSTYWIFVLIGSGAVLNEVFGIAGALAVVLVFLFFYWMGKIHFKLQEYDSRYRQ